MTGATTTLLQREQQALLHAVLGVPGGDDFLPCMPSGSSAQQQLWRRGLQAYQANGQALAVRALGNAYPVLSQLLGEESFALLARHFWACHPPQRGDVTCWGDTLGAFVAASPQLADEPYLGDVARLEWLLHLAAGAADVPADLPSFARLTHDDPASFSLSLSASVALMSSPYPAVSIVNAHLLGSPSLEEAGQRLRESQAEHVLVWRQGFKPCVRTSTAAEHAVLEALKAGCSLVGALEAAGEDASFDFNAWLVEAVQTGLLTGVQDMQINQVNQETP